jgi:hypothetical protein
LAAGRAKTILRIDRSSGTPHPQNWSKEGWTRAVNALKRILKDTSGIKIELPLESVESEAVNSPWSHLRMREDVGDER